MLSPLSRRKDHSRSRRRAGRLGAGVALLLGGFSLSPAQTTSSAPAVPNSPPVNPQLIESLKNEASDFVEQGKYTEALGDLDSAANLSPKDSSLYLKRAEIYARQKLWDRARSDYESALKLLPGNGFIRFQLADLSFVQKLYEDARPAFAGLINDTQYGDLARYKMFLCDLLNGNDPLAQRDLDTMDQTDSQPSYYFANGAWNLFHQHAAKGNQYLFAAGQTFSSATREPYMQALVESGGLDAPTASFSTQEGTAYNHVPFFIEQNGLRVMGQHGWETILYEELSDDLSGFPADSQPDIREKRQQALNGPPNVKRVTFTTRDGRHFDSARASIDGTDLRVETDQGWISVPFSQLPDDLSIFPAGWQEEIMAWSNALPGHAAENEFVTFTTKAGQEYDQVRVSVGDTALNVLTPGGWVAVPFAQLPADLSVFSGNVRQEIEEKEQATQADQQLAKMEVQPAVEPGPAKIPPVWNARPEQPAPPFPSATDSHFGLCVAVDRPLLAVGCQGATYLYENLRLAARLCPDADATGTGDPVKSIAASGDTVATCTQKGVYLWVRSPDGWSLQQQLQLVGAASVALDHDELAVGVDGQSVSNGPVEFYTRRHGRWDLAPKTDVSGETIWSNDPFGRRVAIVGDEALAGWPNCNPGALDNVGADYVGRAWVERLMSGTWQGEAELNSPVPATGANQFGKVVAFSGDRAAVSSSNRSNDTDLPNSGTVVLFRRAGNGWEQQKVLSAPPGADPNLFGAAPLGLWHHLLAVPDPGTPAQVSSVILESGENTHQPGIIRNAGAVYLYDDGQLQLTLPAPNPVDGTDRQGSPGGYATNLALQDDVLAVSAPGLNHGTGAVYVWRRTDGQWHPGIKLNGFHPELGQ